MPKMSTSSTVPMDQDRGAAAPSAVAASKKRKLGHKSGQEEEEEEEEADPLIMDGGQLKKSESLGQSKATNVFKQEHRVSR